MKKLIAGLLLISLLVGTFACAEAPRLVNETVPTAAPPPVIEESSSRVEIAVPAPPGSAPGVVVEMPPAAPVEAPAPVPPKEVLPYDEEQSWATERMIVRTGDMSLVVPDVLTAIEQIAGLAKSYDGYVVSSNSWREGDRLAGTIAIRVLAERFDDAIRALRQMAVEVNQESTSSRDVTEEYVDLSAKLHNLEASEAQLLELMKQAGKVEEILEVQRELAKTRGEIEQTKGRMQYLEQTSSTSLISVYLEQAELDVTFTASTKTVKVGQNIRFDPRIGGGISPYSYEWDFGDGNTSTDVSPIHAYKSEGSYTVILKVTDDRGQVASKERNNYIEVLPGWSAGNTASSAWTGLAAFGRVLADIFVWLGYFSPVWIVIGIILYFAWWRRRKKA
jgi:hypothetical protein